ncbi:hypothetical protein ES708_33025 [subsurface metagenome]
MEKKGINDEESYFDRFRRLPDRITLGGGYRKKLRHRGDRNSQPDRGRNHRSGCVRHRTDGGGTLRRRSIHSGGFPAKPGRGAFPQHFRKRSSGGSQHAWLRGKLPRPGARPAGRASAQPSRHGQHQLVGDTHRKHRAGGSGARGQQRVVRRQRRGRGGQHHHQAGICRLRHRSLRPIREIGAGHPFLVPRSVIQQIVLPDAR